MDVEMNRHTLVLTWKQPNSTWIYPQQKTWLKT